MQGIAAFSLPFKNYEQHTMFLYLKPRLMITCKLGFLDAHATFLCQFHLPSHHCQLFLDDKKSFKTWQQIFCVPVSEL